MVVADLKIGTVVLPRSETPQIVSRLTEFEWFHKIDSTSETVTPEVDDILLKAQQTFQEVDEVTLRKMTQPQKKNKKPKKQQVDNETSA